MDNELKDYLTSTRDEMRSNESICTVYGKYGREIISIGSSNTKKGANNILKEYLNDYEVNEDDIFRDLLCQDIYMDPCLWDVK